MRATDCTKSFGELIQFMAEDGKISQVHRIGGQSIAFVDEAPTDLRQQHP